MSKTLRKILTASSALLMIAGIGATAGNTNVSAKKRHVRSHRIYRHKRIRRHARRRVVQAAWHKGTPKILGKNGNWLSNFKRIKPQKFGHKTISLVRNETPFGGGYGYNPTPGYYTKNHKLVTTGADAGAGASIKPYYKTLGHGWYEVVSGADFYSKHPIKDAEMKVFIKPYGHNKMYIHASGYSNGNAMYHRVSWHTRL